jgi:hypothetical protein
MTTCLCQPQPSAACVEQNWRPQAHSYMMSLPRRYVTADRLLVAALTANGLVERVRCSIHPSPLGARLFSQQFRFCSRLFSLCWFFGPNGRPCAELCDARPDCWRPDPGSVSFRNPCTV